MASVLENIGTFTIERLRMDDAAQLQAAVRPAGQLPQPLAIARGPVIVGPLSAVGDSEQWVVGLAVPAAPDIAWVMVRADFIVKEDAAVASQIPNVALFPIGGITSSALLQGPAFGTDTMLHRNTVASAGTFVFASNPPTDAGKGIWLPLDPDDTASGWFVLFTMRMGTTAPGTSDVEVDFRGVTFLGYPTNVWGTSMLWQNLAFRGS